MNKELTEKLYHGFPKLYRQHSLSKSETSMCWGFSCGDGWFDLIYQLSKKLSAAYPDIEAVQVKQKFGPEAVVVSIGFSGVLSGLDPDIGRFLHCFGSPNRLVTLHD